MEDQNRMNHVGISVVCVVETIPHADPSLFTITGEVTSVLPDLDYFTSALLQGNFCI